MASSKCPKRSEDLISDVLDILRHKIIELLPIRFAARTSVLSKQWHCYWLSLNRLVFDEEFVENVSGDWQVCSNIISGILLHHNGPIHEFSLYIPEERNENCMYLRHWLAFLSKNDVRRIKIFNGFGRMPISSYIFWCSELLCLDLNNLTLHPPSGFNGFPKLQHLGLTICVFSQESVFPSLVAKCRKLVTLKLRNCMGMGMDHIVIDVRHVPSLETLRIFVGDYESIYFKGVCNNLNLKSIALVQWCNIQGKPMTIETIDSFNNLARSCQLQCIELGGDFCQLLAAASIKNPLSAAFNHLNKLTLSAINLSDPSVLQNIFGMVESCPYMKRLAVSIISSDNANYEKLDYTKFKKSPYLVEVKITKIVGTNPEIQLVEYLLTIAIALEILFYGSYKLDTKSELELLKILSGIPRASPKARIVCLS